MTTKKVDGRDLRREPDDAPVEDSSRFRIDRVFVPPLKRESSGPTPMRPVRGRPATRPPTAGGPADSEVVDLRRKLSVLQRQLADLSDEMADKEDQLAAEVSARLELANQHDQLVIDQRSRASQLDAFVAETEARANMLAERLGQELTHVAQLAKERDQLQRERDEMAADRAAHDAAIAEHVDIAAERDALRRAHDEAAARIAALEGTLGEAHARWNAERKEVEDAHAEEIAEIETTLRLSTDTAAAELQRLRELVRNDGTASGLAVAAAKAEHERELATMRKELEGQLAKQREEHAAALTAERASSAGALEGELAKLRMAHGKARAELDSQLETLRSEHEHALVSQRSEQISAAAEAASELDDLRATHTRELAAARAEVLAAQDAAVAERQRSAAEHEQQLAAARAEHVTAKAEAMTELARVRAEHEQAIAAARAEHVTAKAEAMTELERVRQAHEVALRQARTEEATAAKAREDKAQQALSDLVIQHAADQVATSRKNRQEIERVETERAHLERVVEQARRDSLTRESNWEKTMRGHHEIHDLTLAELADANHRATQREEESTARGERLDVVTKELEALHDDLAALRAKLDASEAAHRREREQLLAHLQQGLALLGGAAPVAPAPAPADASQPRDSVVRFRQTPDE